MKRLLLPLAAALISATAFAADQAATPKADAARGQAIVSTVCIACHGPDGNSPLPANPKLAGQHAEYLLKQMKDFKAAEGRSAERTSAVMNAMIMAYDEGQLRDLAAYFAVQVRKGEAAKSAEAVAVGQKLYRAGDLSKGLAACAACHGPAGAGIPSQYPRIGGQFAEYVELQLRNFRDGSRANDQNKMMRMIATKMTDAEIKAVSDYVAGLR